MPHDSPPRIVYLRTAAENPSALAEQREAARRYLGDVPALEFCDTASGSSFDRVGLQAMVRYCEQHPQSLDAPGLYVMLDRARFSRGSLDDVSGMLLHLGRLGRKPKFLR